MKAAAKSEENCATSTYTNCRSKGDFYNLAKTQCEQSGGRLATAAELKAMGKTSGYFWASEEYYSGTAYALYYGDVGGSDKDLSGTQAVCVGK